MKCPKCKKDFKAGVKSAYKLGLQDGRNIYTHTINLLERTNRRILDELRVLDTRAPDSANSVYLSRKCCNRLIKLLKKHRMHKKANEIKRIINKQLGETLSAEAKLRELLSELDEE